MIVVAAAIERDGRYLIARRTRPADVAGRWEFPGGKVEPGETERQALAREIREELGVEIAVGERIPGEWPLHGDLVLHLYRATLASGEPVPGEPVPLEQHDEIRWVAPAEFGTVEWIDADADAVRSLREATA